MAAAFWHWSPRAILSAEQAHARARLHGYLDGSYLQSTQRLFVSVFQTGQVEPHEIREAILYERGAADDHLRYRIAELEQQLAAYRQIVDLSDRVRLERQLYDIGEQIGYRQFIPADHLLAIGHGVEYWRAFAESASDEELAQAIVRVRHYAENLLAVDATSEVQRLKGRIRELERQLAQPI
ncbi:MAG: hypothetical protein ABI406_14165 [Ktedonobacteraceae bacterium]